VCRLRDGAEDGDEQCAGAHQQRAAEAPAREGLAEDQRRTDGIEDEAAGLQRREHGQGQRRDLDRAPQQVRDDEHGHAELPAPPSMGGPSDEVGRLFVLEDVRFALQGEAEGLHAGGEEADEDADLESKGSVDGP